MNIKINKDKSIGKVIFIVEGGKTEPFILHRIFTKIFDYQMEMEIRDKGYRKYNSKDNPLSQVFVLNAEESNIKYIAKDNEYLNNLFVRLIEEYDFDVDNSAIFYLFDRDNQSNTDSEFIRKLIEELRNSRDNPNNLRQGLLLLSYPSVESFTLSNFQKDSFKEKVVTGKVLKQLLEERKINQSQLSEHTICFATEELVNALSELNVRDYNLDDFWVTNKTVFDFEEETYAKEQLYTTISLICISLLDLGLIELED